MERTIEHRRDEMTRGERGGSEGGSHFGAVGEHVFSEGEMQSASMKRTQLKRGKAFCRMLGI